MAQNDHKRFEQFASNTVNEEEPTVHEDLESGIDRMTDEGGGVVDQNFPLGAPILRNDLVRTNKPSADEYDPGQFES